MSGGRIALVITGSLIALFALMLIAGGVALLAVHGSERDAAGFYSTDAEPFRAGSHAIVSDDLDVQIDGPDWLFKEGRLTTVRLRGSSADPDRDLFIGVGPTARVRAYLAGARHHVMTDLDIDPFRPTYRAEPGRGAPGRPAAQRFWTASADGPGTQTVRWDVRDGNWSVVLMNADASPGVNARVSAGAKAGAIFGIGLGLAIGGGLLLLVGGVLLFLGIRRPRDSAASAST